MKESSAQIIIKKKRKWGFAMANLKIGVFGVGRGTTLARNFMMLNCDIVAICDFSSERLEKPKKELGNIAKIYTNFDEFIEHDMDAVVLANAFNEHTPYAIKCLEKGLHVYSECISNATMAEGVELVRAVEKSGCVYMLAENYPQMIFNREIKRVCDTGTLGKILYAEGEYNHPVNPADAEFAQLCLYHPKHWRNYLPATYYITHSIGPVMWATGAKPRRVTAFAAFSPSDSDVTIGKYSGDAAAIITTLNDDDSVFRVTGCARFGAHHSAYRVCGTEGQIENLRGMDDKIMLRYNPWSKPEGAEENNLYVPEWNDPDEERIRKSGHGGSDFLTARTFVECVKKGRQPEYPFDIYGAVTMSSVAILAHRSILEGGKPFNIPDFRKDEDCRLYENDRLTPFYSADGSEPTIACSSKPDFNPEKNKR